MALHLAAFGSSVLAFLVPCVCFWFRSMDFCGAFVWAFLIPREEQFPPHLPTLAHNSSGLPSGYAFPRIIFFWLSGLLFVPFGRSAAVGGALFHSKCLYLCLLSMFYFKK